MLATPTSRSHPRNAVIGGSRICRGPAPLAMMPRSGRRSSCNAISGNGRTDSQPSRLTGRPPSIIGSLPRSPSTRSSQTAPTTPSDNQAGKKSPTTPSNGQPRTPGSRRRPDAARPHHRRGLPVTRAHPLLRRRAVAPAMLRPLPTKRVMVHMAEIPRRTPLDQTAAPRTQDTTTSDLARPTRPQRLVPRPILLHHHAFPISWKVYATTGLAPNNQRTILKWGGIFR